MADKEKYMIKIQGDLIEVSEDVYYAYFRMERQERWQEEKSRKMMWADTAHLHHSKSEHMHGCLADYRNTDD